MKRDSCKVHCYKSFTRSLLFSRFLSLVRPGDGEEYSKTAFLGARIENFKFILLTQLWNPSEELLQKTYPLRVMVPSKSL